jgi:hypothetical protein
MASSNPVKLEESIRYARKRSHETVEEVKANIGGEGRRSVLAGWFSVTVLLT